MSRARFLRTVSDPGTHVAQKLPGLAKVLDDTRIRFRGGSGHQDGLLSEVGARLGWGKSKAREDESPRTNYLRFAAARRSFLVSLRLWAMMVLLCTSRAGVETEAENVRLR